MELLSIHKKFKLNGQSVETVKELLDSSKAISLETYNFLLEWFNNKPVVIVKTSGSTGVPKEIQVQKKHMINSAKATGTYFNLIENTTALLCMSPKFIAGKMILVRALTLGWHLDVVAPVSNPLEGCNQTYDFCAMVPLQLNNSLNNIEKISKLIVGGGVVSNVLLEKIKHVKTNIFATYGMTETVTHIAVKKLNNIGEQDSLNYQVLPNVEVSVDNRNCLIIKASNIADETIITNDIVALISKNKFKWLGRFDNIINSGGIKLIPEQIEAQIATTLSNRFFVAGKKDNLLGEKLILIIEGEFNEKVIQKVQKIDFQINYEKPKEIYFINNFIETSTQKINRKETLKLLKYTC